MMMAGYLDQDCEEVSPRSEISLTELLKEELTGDSQRARRSVLGLPPLITTAGEKPQCKLCEKKGTLCFLFGLGKAGPHCGLLRSFSWKDPSKAVLEPVSWSLTSVHSVTLQLCLYDWPARPTPSSVTSKAAG